MPTGPNDVPSKECVIADCGQLTGEEYKTAGDKALDSTGDPYEDFPEDQKPADGEALSTVEVIKIGTHLKTIGNDVFKKGDLHLGLEKYQKGLRYLHECPEALDTDPPETGDQLNALKITLHSNSALLQIKLKDFSGAETSASYVLDVAGLKDAEKGKALYRRALAKKGLKNEDDATKDLEAALKCVPEDAAIKNELAAVKKAKADREKKEKAAYSKFFS